MPTEDRRCWRQCLLIAMTLRSSRVTARQGGNFPVHLVETAEAEYGGDGNVNMNIKIFFREFREYSYLFLLSCDNLKWLSSPTFCGSAPWQDKLWGWPVPYDEMQTVVATFALSSPSPPSTDTTSSTGIRWPGDTSQSNNESQAVDINRAAPTVW